MKFLKLIFICSVYLISCNKPVKELKKEIDSEKNSFLVQGTFTNYFTKKVYLNKIQDASFILIDSADVTANKFTFNGFVRYPERFALTFENYSVSVPLIIENTTIQIKLKPNQINQPEILGSKLNIELEAYKTASKKIFKKIDFLFPKFQKARLENDAKQLAKISAEMKAIENEFTKFTYNFIEQNNNSYVAAMLLRDQLKPSKIDTLKIVNTYNLLSEEIKLGPDAQFIATKLNLH